MLWLMALTVVTALPPPVPTHPGFVDAAQLAAICSADGPEAEGPRALCLGYVTGAVDQLLARVPGRRPATVCPPADLTPKAAVDAVMRYARFAATGKGIGAADFVRFALERAYPCPVDRSRR
ncbi:MAG: hypothetical protein EPO51_12835 [Phenylobacterium sp.]|uniref:Rap1a/Tai family immunity protein n=1 Tax=Phenylobacterium sp. TaxID=1871053 RepID=UPI00121F2BFB|nr:Rap1a/Tai family immunity protein [Phenylobacterium sp.]TAJ71993.1 MAG: hypothetical protein EPO51_12835 [Phenylobacterium sp.]